MKILKTIKIHLNSLTHISKSRKLFPKNGRWLKGFFGNYFQVNFMSTHEKIFFPKNGSWLRGFSGTFFQYLEKVSENSPGSLPEFTKFQLSFKIIDFGKSFNPSHSPKVCLYGILDWLGNLASENTPTIRWSWTHQ